MMPGCQIAPEHIKVALLKMPTLRGLTSITNVRDQWRKFWDDHVLHTRCPYSLERRAGRCYWTEEAYQDGRVFKLCLLRSNQCLIVMAVPYFADFAVPACPNVSRFHARPSSVHWTQDACNTVGLPRWTTR